MNLFLKLYRIPASLRWGAFALSLYVLYRTSMRIGNPPDAGKAAIPFEIEFTYNLGHQFLYGYFALTLLLVLPRQSLYQRVVWVWMPTLVALMGILDEWNQSFRNRGSGMNDVCSDVMGAVHILILALWFSKARKPWQTAVLISTQVWIGVSWNLVVVYAPDPPLPFVPVGP